MPADGTPAVIPQRYEAEVPLDRLVLHPANPNESDLGMLSGSLDALGFYGAVIAQESTGIICAGNHRLALARERGMATLPVVWADVTDDQRDRILLMDNQSTRLGTWNEPALVAFLQGLAATPDGLAGTGFDGNQLDDMIRFLAPPALDDLGGNDDPSVAWPSVTIRAPHHVVAAWNDHAKAYDGDGAAAFAQLLGLELEP